MKDDELEEHSQVSAAQTKQYHDVRTSQIMSLVREKFGMPADGQGQGSTQVGGEGAMAPLGGGEGLRKKRKLVDISGALGAAGH